MSGFVRIDVRPPADLPALLDRRVAVVDRGPQARERVARAASGTDPARAPSSGRGRAPGCCGSRASASRTGRLKASVFPDAVPVVTTTCSPRAAASQAVALVGVELRHADRRADARVELLRERREPRPRAPAPCRGGRAPRPASSPSKRSTSTLMLDRRGAETAARMLASPAPGCPAGAEITPVEPDPGRAGEGSATLSVPRVPDDRGSDCGGGAGIQADLKAFAAAGVHGMSAIVALTAQNTIGVTAVHELPPEFVVAQLEAVFSDIGVDAAKTGMLFSRRVIETVADVPRASIRVPLVVDPVMVASSGARLLAGRRGRRARRRGSSRSRPSSRRTCSRRGRSPGGDGHAARAGRAARTSSARRGDRHRRPRRAPVDHLFDGTRARRDPGRAARRRGHARRRLHALGDARRAARARRCRSRRRRAAAARPRRRGRATGSPSSARATARSTSST